MLSPLQDPSASEPHSQRDYVHDYADEEIITLVPSFTPKERRSHIVQLGHTSPTWEFSQTSPINVLFPLKEEGK